MFSFSKENPSKIVALSGLTITASWNCDPMVWTPQFQDVTTKRVFVLCSKNSKGRDVFRVYPLNVDKNKPFPPFVILPHEHEILKRRTTHICFEHKNFVITRPLLALYYRTKINIDRKNLDFLPDNLLTLIKHCYLKDVIDDNILYKVESRFDKISKILPRLEKTEFQGEAEVCRTKIFEICKHIFKDIEKYVEKEKESWIKTKA